MASDKAEFEVELVDDVTKPAKKAGNSIDRLKKTLSRFNDSSIGKMGGKLAGFAKSAVTMGALVGGALVGGISAAAVGMVDFGQRSRQAFSLLAKDGENAEGLFQRSMGVAADLGLEVKSTVKQIQKFRALQFTQDQAESLIKMGADMQALGASTEEVSRVFAQLGQIKAKNKLQSEELVTLAESGVSTQVVFAALAKQLGKTEDQVKAMVSAGAINGSQALNAIGTAILFKTGTKQFGEAGKMMAENTLSGMAGVFKAKAQVAFFGIADSAQGEINNAGKAIFDELNGFLGSKSGKNMAKGLGDAIAWIANTIRESIPFVKQFLAGFGEGSSAAFQQVAGAFKMVLGPLTGGDGKMGLALMKSIGETLGVLTVLLGGAVLAFGALTGAMIVTTNVTLRTLKGVWNAFVSTFGGILFAVADFWANLSSVWSAEGMSLSEKSYEIGKMLVMGLVRGIKELYLLPGNMMLNVAANTIAAAKGAFQQHSPSKVFEDIGANNVMGLNKGHEKFPVQSAIAGTLGNDNGVPVRGNLSGAPKASSGGAGRGVSIGAISITVQAMPGVTPQQAREQGQALGDAFHDRIQEYFDDIALEEAV